MSGFRELALNLVACVEDYVAGDPDEQSEEWRALCTAIRAAADGEPVGPTVTVRIAVMVDECGDYGAIGASPASYRSLEDDARDTEGAALVTYRDAVGEKAARRKHVVWVTASVPLPQSVEVQGTTEEQS